MKVVVGVIVGILVLVVVVGAAAVLGLVPVSTFIQRTNVQASPPLQPLPSQASDTGDMMVTLSERYFNRQIAENLPQGREVEGAQIDIHPNNSANVTAAVQVNSQLRVTPNASVQLGVQNGRIVIDITRVDVGGFAVPGNLIEPQIAELKQTAESHLNTQLAELERTTGLTLESMSTSENSLTLVFGD